MHVLVFVFVLVLGFVVVPLSSSLVFVVAGAIYHGTEALKTSIKHRCYQNRSKKRRSTSSIVVLVEAFILTGSVGRSGRKDKKWSVE